MRLLPCKNWSDLLFLFFLLIPGRYLMGITEFCFWCQAFQKMECPHLCPMRFLHTKLQHFILRFIKMCLLCGYHWNCGHRGWKEVQRQGEDMVTLRITLFSSKIKLALKALTIITCQHTKPGYKNIPGIRQLVKRFLPNKHISNWDTN